MARTRYRDNSVCGDAVHKIDDTTPELVAVPRITANPRGFVRVSLDGLVGLVRHLAAALNVGTPAALGLAGEVLVVLVDVADRDGQVAPAAGWSGADQRHGYRHRLIAPAGWSPRLKQLAAAGVLEIDGAGRLVRVAPRWQRRLTQYEVAEPDGSLRTVPSAILQRTALRELTTQLREARDGRGRTRPGAARLLALTVLLCCSTVSRERGHVSITQRQLAELLGMRLATVNGQLQRLVELGLVVSPDRHRGQHATAAHLAWIGTLSDRLAGREWVLEEAPEDPPVAPEHCSGSIRSSVPVPPVPGVGLCEGSTSSGSSSSGDSGTAAPAARGGEIRGQTKSDFAQRVDQAWRCGPSTKPQYQTWTTSAVAALPHTVVSLEAVLEAYADKPEGRRLRATLREALEQAREVMAAWFETGVLPSSSDRDLVDAVARLARRVDRVMEANGGGYPPAVLAGAFCEEDPGELTPLYAVLLAAHRLPSDHNRSHGRGGAWRTGQHHPVSDSTAHPVLTHDRLRSPSGGVEVEGVLGQLGLASRAPAPAPTPQPSRQSRTLVDRLVIETCDGALQEAAATTVFAWRDAALAWWAGPPPPTIDDLSDTGLRAIIAAWVDHDPAQARTLTRGALR